MRLISYARVSTRPQDTDRQEQDLLAAGVRREYLYVDQGLSGARAHHDRRLTELSPLSKKETPSSSRPSTA
jgi:DNA invertase Pin-like site-specific DNA recombinase